MHVNADPNVVYMRTQRGQAVALAHEHAFSRPEMLVVLRLVNGFTPAEALEGLVSQQIPDALALLRDLEARGLIERVIDRVQAVRPMHPAREVAHHH